MTKAQKQKQNKEIIFQRQTLALHYRIAGLNFRQIGARLSTSHTQAISDVRAAFKLYASATAESIEEAVELEIQRLDTMHLAIWAKATKGDLPSIDRCLKIVDLRCKLLGLYKPTKIAPTNIEGDKPYEPAPSRDEQMSNIEESVARIEELLERARARRDKAAREEAEKAKRSGHMTTHTTQEPINEGFSIDPAGAKSKRFNHEQNHEGQKPT